MSEFTAVKKNSVVDEVFNQFLEKIINGEWAQDSKIPSENELRESLSVSRDTVRQALKRLSALGLLQSEQGKGTFVRKIDTAFYMNLLVPSVFLTENDSSSVLEFMKAIQVECARIASMRATDRDIDELKKDMDAMTKAKNFDDYFYYDNNYHRYLTEITKNSLFTKSMEIASHLLKVYLKDLVVIHGSSRSTEQHRKCLDAIIKHDTEAAVTTMAEHYDMLAERLRRRLKDV